MDICLGNHCVNCLFDSGSSVSLINASFVEEMGYKIDTRCSKRLISASGNDLDFLGEVILPIIIGKAQMSHDFIVVSGLTVSAREIFWFLCLKLARYSKRIPK